MQNHLIAVIQNVKILLKHMLNQTHAETAVMSATISNAVAAIYNFHANFFRRVKTVQSIFLPGFVF